MGDKQVALVQNLNGGKAVFPSHTGGESFAQMFYLSHSLTLATNWIKPILTG